MKAEQTLIDRAIKTCSSAYQLSKLTGTSQGALSDMVHGGREVPPALAGELAAIVGEDPREAALAALVAKEKRPERRARLASLFGLEDWRKRWLPNFFRRWSDNR